MLKTSKPYVDKSRFIREILRIEDSYLYITRPKGWGKSTNASLLKYFFQQSPNNIN